jgi:uncharacterized Zn ribbon protein
LASRFARYDVFGRRNYNDGLPATGEGDQEGKVVHKDSNGVLLQNGDSVVLIKDLDVSMNFTAKKAAVQQNILVWGQ